MGAYSPYQDAYSTGYCGGLANRQLRKQRGVRGHQGTNPLDRFARGLPPGTLTWIGLRTQRRGKINAVECARAIASHGLEGDHRMGKTAGSARQVTLISEEFMQQIAHFTARDSIDPVLLRRNLVVSGINLNAKSEKIDRHPVQLKPGMNTQPPKLTVILFTRLFPEKNFNDFYSPHVQDFAGLSCIPVFVAASLLP